MILTAELAKPLLSGPVSTAGYGGGASVAKDAMLYWKWGVLWHALLLSPTPYPLWPKSPPLLLSPFPVIELICLSVWTPRTIFSKSFFTPPSHSLPLEVGEPPGSSLSCCEGIDVTPFPREKVASSCQSLERTSIVPFLFILLVELPVLRWTWCGMTPEVMKA